MYNTSTKFFLGANSASGFYSLYDNFTDLKSDTLYILKGGPGCGKSTFMKRIGKKAEDMGHSVDYIHCSGDPDSLDAIYIENAHLAFVDGTAPHAVVFSAHRLLSFSY